VGDLLAIKFFRNPELNEELTVRPDGMISLQLVGEIRAAGLSPAELNAVLAKRYADEVADPRVTTIVRDTAGQRVYIGGEVARPGLIKLRGGLTAFQAVQEAGGFLKSARMSEIVLIRRGVDDASTGHLIDLRPVQQGERPEVDVPLQPYDVVFVPRSKIADVNLFVEMYIRNNLPIQQIPVTFVP
jgi:protein involved in polysaccharide export with SLBB domain